MKKVFITDYINNPDIEKKILSKTAEVICLNQEDDKKFPKEVLSADGFLVWHAKITEETINRLKKKCAIIRYGVGYDNIDLNACKKNNILFANTPDYGTDEVADTASALILNLVRKVNLYNNLTKQDFGDWQEEVPKINLDFPISRTSDHSLGIIGLGRIGSALALRMKKFKMKVGFYDPHIESGYEKVLGISRFSTLDELKSNSSIISINATLNDQTKNMVNENFIKTLKKNTILINTARGKIIENLKILFDGLKNKQLSAIGLDVLPEEPPNEQDKLIQTWKNLNDKMSNRIIINPHAAYYSSKSIEEMRIKASENLQAFLEGKKVKNIINI